MGLGENQLNFKVVNTFLIGPKFNRNSVFLSICLALDLALQSSKSSVRRSLCANVGWERD